MIMTMTTMLGMTIVMTLVNDKDGDDVNDDSDEMVASLAMD